MGESDPKTTCISEHDRALTVNALEEFNNNNYGTCIQNLVELESSIGVDPCIIHNKAVAEFYKSDFKNYEQFHKVLNQLIGKSADANNYEFENVKMATVYFNKAVVLFQMRQHQAALKIMFAVMKHIDKLDDKLIQRCGLLTINLLLNTNQPKKADALVELLQIRLNISSESLTSDEDDDSDVTRDKKKEKSLKSLDYFKWMFRLYKIRSNVLNVKNLLIPNEDTSEISILRGHQYYNGIDYQMAAKELSKNFTNLQSNIKKNGEDHNTIIANNMGIIHFQVRHYAMAARFFQHSLTFDQTAMESVGGLFLVSEVIGIPDKGWQPHFVTLETTMGEMIIELYWKHAPNTCRNFAELVRRGYYNNTIFHRIIRDFMIQGGDPTGTGRGGTSIYGQTFADEINPDLKHTGAGILSMANSGPDTNGSQFFITLAPTQWLDGKHTIFGRIHSGMQVVKRIGLVECDKSDKPIENVRIVRSKIEKF